MKTLFIAILLHSLFLFSQQNNSVVLKNTIHTTKGDWHFKTQEVMDINIKSIVGNFIICQLNNSSESDILVGIGDMLAKNKYYVHAISENKIDLYNADSVLILMRNGQKWEKSVFTKKAPINE